MERKKCGKQRPPAGLSATQQHSRWQQRLSQLMLPDDAQEAEINVGQRLQELRQMRGLSQRALDEMSGLNFNTLYTYILTKLIKYDINFNSVHKLLTTT